MRRRVLGAVLVAVLTAGLLGACSSDDDAGDNGNGSDTSASITASPEAAEAALAVCGVLIAFDNTVASEVNAASRQIHQDTDPDEARELLLEASGNIQAAVDALPDGYAALGLTADGDIGRLVADGAAATDGLDEQLESIRTNLTDGLEGEGPREILSATFIDFEKIQSLAQPYQGDYDADLAAALAAEPDCEHTISR